jgi:hypothetical protein
MSLIMKYKKGYIDNMGKQETRLMIQMWKKSLYGIPVLSAFRRSTAHPGQPS